MARPVITDKPILDQAEFNGVTIWRKEGGSIEVSDTNYPSMRAALLDIAQKAGIEVEEGWNTQYLGWYIIQQLKKAGDINIGSSEDGIIAELALSQQYDLEVDDNNMVVLSKTNVAKVEAMIRNDSDYINNTPFGPIDEKDFNGSAEYWAKYYLKLVIEGKKTDKDEREIVKNFVKAVDRENSTHLNSDNVGIDQITDRVMSILHTELLSLLKKPGKEYRLISILSAPTQISEDDKVHKSRRNYSFATKFCHYACFYLFEGLPEQDNFSIYDNVAQSAIPYYAAKYGVKCDASEFKDYSTYISVIDTIISKSNSKISRNGFDHLLWYYYKGRMELLSKTY